MKDTLCGPVFALHHMLSGLFKYNISFESERSIATWTRKIVAKVVVVTVVGSFPKADNFYFGISNLQSYESF